MNKLSIDRQVAVISALVEGCSIRSTVRMTGVAKGKPSSGCLPKSDRLAPITKTGLSATYRPDAFRWMKFGVTSAAKKRTHDGKV